MPWVSGFGVNNGQLAPRLLFEDGTTTWANLHEIPDLSLSMRDNLRIISTAHPNINFGNLTKVDSTQYLRAFGFDLEDRYSDTHAVFSAYSPNSELTFLIPALLFIRALFRENPRELRTVFLPGFAAKLAFPVPVDSDTFSLQLRIASQKAQTRTAGRVVDWMLSHPSAVQMINSMHVFAMQGALDFVLPFAAAKMRLKGVKIDDCMYVTDFAISNLVPLEDRFFWLKNAVETGSAFKELELKQAGRFRPLSDAEWDVIEGILASSRKSGVPKGNQKIYRRDLLDALLERIVMETPWRLLRPKSGNYANVLHMTKTWRHGGYLETILSFLMEARSEFHQ